MRIVAGKFGGRTLHEPHGHRTHPMSEKVRGALFNVLGDIEGLTVLDAFAGSGALSFEALSRGAAHVTATEIDKNSHSVIQQNIQELGVSDQVKAINANSSGWSDNNPDAKFDIVFLAPPYDNLQMKLLVKLSKHIKPDGLLVLDWPGHLDAPKFKGFESLSDKNYGDAQLVFYRKIS